MSQFNIFMNPYQQPENKLTYNFLCLLEHLPLPKQKALLEFLIDQRFRLSTDPCFAGEGVFSGQVSNPDGKLRVYRDDGQALEIYLENKTVRSPLSKDQLLQHIHTYCHNDTTFLLVLTPRPTDFPIVQVCMAEVGQKLLFKTWGDIVRQLTAFVRQDQDFLAAQFVEYGTLSGEFTDMELEASDILHYVGYHSREVVKRLRFVVESAARDVDYAQWDASIRCTGSADGYGRMGCCFQWDNHYGLEWFFGIYYHTFDHQIPFKQDAEPELAFFLDMDPRYKDALRAQAPAREACERLTRQGFESNLCGELTSNPWRLLAHRTPLLQCDEFSIGAVGERLRTLLQLVYAERAFIGLIKQPIPATPTGLATAPDRR